MPMSNSVGVRSSHGPIVFPLFENRWAGRDGSQDPPPLFCIRRAVGDTGHGTGAHVEVRSLRVMLGSHAVVISARLRMQQHTERSERRLQICSLRLCHANH